MHADTYAMMRGFAREKYHHVRALRAYLRSTDENPVPPREAVIAAMAALHINTRDLKNIVKKEQSA